MSPSYIGLILLIGVAGTGWAHGPGFHYDGNPYDSFDHTQHDGPPGSRTSFRNPNIHQGCVLPDSWHGRYFQSGLNLQPVTIDGRSIATKGICLESQEDKFLFFDKTLHCHKCLVINERHRNVLQYKESPDCESNKDSLDNLCSRINGDAQLFSLFRLDALPEECPFRGAPFNLTYNRGHGECRKPVSRVESCTENSRLLLRFQACPNVEKTESKTEELECLAQWREGSNHYLLGKLESPMRNSDLNYEEKYRCFIWKRIKEHDSNGHATITYKVAQSGDATCAGVQSPTEGARALTLVKLDQGSVDRCKFPHWFSSHRWQTLNGRTLLKMQNHKNTTIHVTEHVKRNGSIGGGGHGGHFNTNSRSRSSYSLFTSGSRILCQSRLDVASHHVTLLAQHMEGCKSETICLNLFKRDSHIVEIQVQTGSPSGDCGNELGFMTLVSASPPPHRCPNLGKYLATGVSGDGGRLVRESCGDSPGDLSGVAVGCGDEGTMEFHTKCATQEPITSYACYGSWREGEAGFLIASPLSRSSTGARRFCFVYKPADSGLRVWSSSESCRRNVRPGIVTRGSWAFNLTSKGPCAERLTSGGGLNLKSSFLLFSVITTLLLGSTSPAR